MAAKDCSALPPDLVVEAALPYSFANDPEHWRKRAEEARAMAEYLTSPEARRHMLNCAASYERLAQLSEKSRIYERPLEGVKPS